MRRVVLLTIALIGLCSVLWAVGSGPLAGRADLVIINRGDVNTLDVQRMSWLQDYRVAAALFEGLLTADRFSPGFDPRPGVAERWTISEDGKTYTFFLRANARWSDGSAVTARDFVYSWRRALLPDLTGDYATLFRLIEGGADFYTWREGQLAQFADKHKGAADATAAQAGWDEAMAYFERTVGIVAEDDRTLRVRLIRPVPYWLDLMAFEAFFPVCEKVVSRFEQPSALTGRLEYSSGWTKPETLACNGRYRLGAWRFRQDMVLLRNEHHWDARATRCDRLLLASVSDPNAQVMAFQTGAVDMLTDVVPDYRAELILAKERFYAENHEEVTRLRAMGLDPVAIDRRLPRDPRQNIHTFPTFGTYWFSFNCSERLIDGRPNPFADARVRRAFAMSVDKEMITQNIRRAGEPVAGSIVPPGSIRGYSPPSGLPKDLELARKLLSEAGYPAGQGMPEIELLFNRDGGHDLIAESLRRDWQRTLGVRVRLVQKEITPLRDDLKKQNFMIARGSWFGDYGDPTTFLDVNRSTDNNNDRKYSSPRFDALMAASDVETDRAKRMELLRQAERLIVEEDLPVLPLFYFVSTMMFDAHRVSGVSPHPRQKQDFGILDNLEDDKGPRGIAGALEMPVPANGSGDARRLAPAAERNPGGSGGAK